MRASFGLEQSLLDNLNYRLDQTAPYNATLSYSGTTVSDPIKGKSTISPSSVQTDIATPSTLAWTLKVEQQVAPQTSLTLAYIGSHSYHQILSQDENEPAFVICPDAACSASLAAGTIYYPTTVKANPAVTNTTSWVSNGGASYNAFEVDVRRAYANGLQFRANYTWSKNLDNGSAWNTSVSANTPAFVSVPQRPDLDWVPAATDIRHIASINGSWELPFGRDHRFASNSTSSRPRCLWLDSIGHLQPAVRLSLHSAARLQPNRFRRHAQPGTAGCQPELPRLALRRRIHVLARKSVLQPCGVPRACRRRCRQSATRHAHRPRLREPRLLAGKSTTIHERLHAQFRAEFFNVLNHTNLMTPNPVVFSTGPQQSTSSATRTQSAVLSPTAGVVTAAATSRQIQFGLKLLF